MLGGSASRPAAPFRAGRAPEAAAVRCGRPRPGDRTWKPSSSPPPAARSDGPTRARSSTSAPTTSARPSCRRCSTKVPAARPQRGRGRHLGLRAARRRGRLQRRRGSPRCSPALDGAPGRHRQPLLLVVAADHPHGRARDQGRRGRRVRRRRRRDGEPLPVGHVRRRARHAQRAVRRRRGAHRGAQPRAARRRGRRSPVSPTSTSRWARPPRTSPSTRR